MCFSHEDRKAQSTDLRASVIHKRNEAAKKRKNAKAARRRFSCVFAEKKGGRSEEVTGMAKEVVQFCRLAHVF